MHGLGVLGAPVPVTNTTAPYRDAWSWRNESSSPCYRYYSAMSRCTVLAYGELQSLLQTLQRHVAMHGLGVLRAPVPVKDGLQLRPQRVTRVTRRQGLIDHQTHSSSVGEVVTAPVRRP